MDTGTVVDTRALQAEGFESLISGLLSELSSGDTLVLLVDLENQRLREFLGKISEKEFGIEVCAHASGVPSIKVLKRKAHKEGGCCGFCG